MSWDEITAIATVILATATVALAVGIPITLVRTSKTLKEQKNSRYYAHYQRIITHLPYGIFQKGNKISQVDDKTKSWILAYIDLCAEELFDFQRGAIEKGVWNEWQELILSAYDNSTILKQIFEEVKADYPSLGQFLRDRKVPSLVDSIR